MTPKQKYKAKIKARVIESNRLESLGFPADPWVVLYRIKNNEQAMKLKASKPPKPPRVYKINSGCFKAGAISPNKITDPIKIAEALQRQKDKRKKYGQDNRLLLNEKRRLKKQNNIGFRMACNLRKRLSFLVRLHSIKKTQQTLSLLGCPMPDFLKHLESKFQDGMSFSNYGEWHIDHKIPCAMFDLTKPEQQAICFHYTNLQPLWAKDNLVKNKRLL